MTATAAGKLPACGGRRHFRHPDIPVQAWLLRLADLDAGLRTPPPEPATTTASEALSERRLARIVIRHWLAELLGCTPDAVTLQRDEFGKLHLPGRQLQFNVSHSRHWLMLAWSDQVASVGADVEDTDRAQAWDRLAQRYFHAGEQAAWRAADDGRRVHTWLSLWTRKEAVLKAHGLGLRLPLATLDTTGEAVQHPELGHWRMHSDIIDDAVFSLAWPA